MNCIVFVGGLVVLVGMMVVWSYHTARPSLRLYDRASEDCLKSMQKRSLGTIAILWRRRLRSMRPADEKPVAAIGGGVRLQEFMADHGAPGRNITLTAGVRRDESYEFANCNPSDGPACGHNGSGTDGPAGVDYCHGRSVGMNIRLAHRW